MTSLRHLMDPAYAARRPMSEPDSADHDIDMSQVTMMCISDPFWPDEHTPAHVRDAAIASVRDGGAHYTDPKGDSELRAAIAAKLARVNGLSVHPDRNITVAGSGGDALLLYVTRPFLEPGQRNEILTPTPGFPTNFDLASLSGAVTVPVPTYPDDGYDLHIEEFEKRLTPRTKIVLITNPNNPTTTVYRRNTLERLAEFVIANDLVLVSDQSFEELAFDGYRMSDVVTLPGMAERTILLCSLSKGMGLCGYRIGYAVASEDISEVLHSSHHYGVANTAAQAGALAALRHPGFVDEYRQEHQTRAAEICAVLDTIPHLTYTPPESGFYLWIDVAAYGGAHEVTRYLLREAAVLPTEGGMFGSTDHLRLVYGTYTERGRIIDSVDRMADALRRHPVNA